jgi:hypothetical protein
LKKREFMENLQNVYSNSSTIIPYLILSREKACAVLVLETVNWLELEQKQ